MEKKIDYDALDAALRRCGSTWDAAQAHGLLTGVLSAVGVGGAPDWLTQVLENTDEANALRQECQGMLDELYQSTFWELSERLSEFTPLLPDDAAGAGERVAAMAHWSEGFLHGLVSKARDEALKTRLAAEPLADIIRDMLELTRAEVGEDADEESNEAAYAELVEYLRVAAQLAYEELADRRHAGKQ